MLSSDPGNALCLMLDISFPADFDPISDPEKRKSDSQICQPKTDSRELPGKCFLLLNHMASEALGSPLSLGKGCDDVESQQPHPLWL